MKKLIYSILFVGMLSVPVTAMQNNGQPQPVRPGDKITLGDGRRVEFVSVNRPPNARGMELVYGLGWVKVINWGRRRNTQNNSSSLTDTLTDSVLSRFMAFSSAWIVAWLKKEAVEEQLEGYVELAPIVTELLSNGVWESVKNLPGTLLTLSLDGSWKPEEKDMIKAATNLFTSKFSDKYEDETVDNIDEFVANLGIEGLYIDPVRISKILHDSANSWDKAAGLRNVRRARCVVRRNNATVGVTRSERRQIREILGVQIRNSQIERNIKQGYLNAKKRRNNPFVGNFGQFLVTIIDGAGQVGMANDIAGYLDMTYK